MPNNEFGDFQTPLELAELCLATLQLPENIRFFEPTCGQGAFLQAAASRRPTSERFGIELNPNYAQDAARWGRVETANIFTTDLGELTWSTGAPLVVIGNPPWVTSADLKKLGSKNLPTKENYKQAKGLEARLGSANFDVAEYIIAKILKEIDESAFTVGMLCKTQVARNVLMTAKILNLQVNGAKIYPIDSRKWFGAGVDACWFVVQVNRAVSPSYTAEVFSSLEQKKLEKAIGFVGEQWVAHLDRYRSVQQIDGACPLTWRSGLKHDAARVFELTATPEPTAADGTTPKIEDGFIFPLLKSTDIFRGRHQQLNKWIIVPQKYLGEDTSKLETTAPNLWNYLTQHRKTLEARRSSIYANRPPFSVFGHGNYTYAPYKIAVSGLHKQVKFRLVKPIADKPVTLDDTCYFLSFGTPTAGMNTLAESPESQRESASQAALVLALLHTEEVANLIESLVFWDSKRPITKRLLSRISLGSITTDSNLIIQAAHTIAIENNLPFDPISATDFLKKLRES